MDIRSTEVYRKYQEAKKFVEEYEKAYSIEVSKTYKYSEQKRMLWSIREDLAGRLEFQKRWTGKVKKICEQLIKNRRKAIKRYLLQIYKPSNQ